MRTALIHANGYGNLALGGAGSFILVGLNVIDGQAGDRYEVIFRDRGKAGSISGANGRCVVDRGDMEGEGTRRGILSTAVVLNLERKGGIGVTILVGIGCDHQIGQVGRGNNSPGTDGAAIERQRGPGGQ